MVQYNLTNVSGANNVFQLADALILLMDGWLFGYLLIALFVVMVLVNYHKGIRISFASAGILCFVLSSIFFTLGLIDVYLWIVSLLVMSMAATGVAIWGD